jgi:2-methylisocitrate lyase-like PEP mutase family enzyme
LPGGTRSASPSRFGPINAKVIADAKPGKFLMAAGEIRRLISCKGEAVKRSTTVLREMLATDGIIVHPGIYDALSAKIAERVGFKMVSLGGYALGAHLGIGEPLLCLEDLVRTCRYITAAINIPLKVDADAGFGEPIHVMRTIRELETAGVAAAHIEDQIYPKRAHYHQGIEHLINEDDMVAKLRAAVTARRDPDFVLIARTDAMRTDGFAEGVRRANLYLEAGADVALVFPNTVEEAHQAPREIHGPVAYLNSDGNRQGRPLFSVREMEDMGYKLVSYAISCINVAAMATKQMLETLMATGWTGLDQEQAREIRKYVEDSIGLEEMYRLERQTVEE